MTTFLRSLHLAGILAASALSACAGSADYVRADSVDDVGHYSTRLGDDRYRIVYNGKRSANLDTTRNYALLRAAELTLQDGNDWFRVIDRETSSVQRQVPSGGVMYERAYRVQRSCNLLGCRESVQPATYTTVGIDRRPSATRHSHALEIVMGKGETPADDGNYYDASILAQSLWASM